MSRLIILIALGVAAYLIYKMYFKQLARQGKPGMLKIGLIVFGLILVLMAITGRTHAAFALVGALMTQVMRILPLLVRFLPMLQQFTNVHKVNNPGSGNQSRVRTSVLIMTLDHDSGHMDGEVIEGEFTGRKLSELSPEELRGLLQECQRIDPEASRLLRAYLSRHYADENWGDADEAGSEQRISATSTSEALEILGLEEGATQQEVTDAHRRLMGKMHPDKGGSTYLAAKINAAKETLQNRQGTSD